MGKIVSTAKCNEFPYYFDMSEMASGMYVVVITYKDALDTHLFIKGL